MKNGLSDAFSTANIFIHLHALSYNFIHFCLLSSTFMLCHFHPFKFPHFHNFTLSQLHFNITPLSHFHKLTTSHFHPLPSTFTQKVSFGLFQITIDLWSGFEFSNLQVDRLDGIGIVADIQTLFELTRGRSKMTSSPEGEGGSKPKDDE